MCCRFAGVIGAGAVIALLLAVTLTSPNSTATAANVTTVERQAVIDFYTATGGSGWKNHTGWAFVLTGGDPCNPGPAFGLTCTNTSPNHIS